MVKHHARKQLSTIKIHRKGANQPVWQCPFKAGYLVKRIFLECNNILHIQHKHELTDERINILTKRKQRKNVLHVPKLRKKYLQKRKAGKLNLQCLNSA